VTPIQRDATIFVSKAMKALDSTKKPLLEIDPEANLDQYFGETDDVIEIDRKGVKTHVFDKQLPSPSPLWQQVKFKNIRNNSSSFRMLDETGIVVALPRDHVSPVSRHLALLYEDKSTKRGFSKHYVVSNTFKV
jgi:hypothetical protein